MKAKMITIILMVIMSMLMMTACGSSGALEKQADVVTETETSDVGAEKVKQIVLAEVPGAVESSIYEFERDYDDGRLEYEGSLYHDGYEYEFEVDGATGNILKWEIDD